MNHKYFQSFAFCNSFYFNRNWLPLKREEKEKSREEGERAGRRRKERGGREGGKRQVGRDEVRKERE
tara:strand:- start:2686 stop:2886 length:201 start_codon:yes stop_codon:yes gene_type:complete